MRRLLDAICRILACVLLRVFYRSVEVTGAEQIPADGPVIFVANHPNSLIDPFLLVGFLPRSARFLAKNTLWQNPALLPLLSLGGALPIYRAQDGEGTARNGDTFERCHQELAAGGAIALFPEGKSYDAPGLQPLRTGAARIALGAEARHGPLGVRVVPVGISFESKGRFRSRVLLRVGAPIEPGSETASQKARAGAADAGSDRDAVRALTERIGAGLAEVTVSCETWDEARLLERAAEICTGAETDLPGRPPLSERFQAVRALQKRASSLRRTDPQRLARIARDTQRYDALLAALGVRDDHVRARYRKRQVTRWLASRIAALSIWLPAAAIGSALNQLPCRLAAFVGRRAGTTPDLPATYTLLTAFFLLPVVWGVEAWAAALAFGPWPGILAAALAPLCGLAAVTFRERAHSLSDEARALRALHGDTARAWALRALRRRLRASIRAEFAEAPVEAARA